MNKNYSEMLQKYKMITLILHCQQFIEFIKEKQFIQGMEYAEIHLNNAHKQKIKALDEN